MAQNVGDAAGMAKAIKNIPYHCFNQHANCGTWCGYHKNPETYKHSSIGEGFHNENLFEALKCLFDVLASKTERFVAGVSSNANESLNSIIASKALKSRFYGTSTSGDYRLACAINKKNDGEEYVAQLAQKLSLSPGKHTTKYGNTIASNARKRYLRSSTRDFKKRRILLKKMKTQLRHRKEFSEGPETYQSDMALLNSDIPTIVEIPNNLSLPIIVFFDLETGGFSKTADILQIAAKHETSTFSIYINSTQKIDERASQVTGLRIVAGQLQYRNNSVTSFPLSEAMQQFYKFLSGFHKKCILVAHNCKFDYPRLLAVIQKTFLIDHFKTVLHGFCDTLPIIKKCTGLTGKGENKLEQLASNLQISTTDAHNAINDVIILEQIIIKLGIPNQNILESTLTWNQAIEKKAFHDNLPNALKKLSVLSTCTSLATRKKLIAANISYDLILDSFKQHKLIGLLNLFGEDENGIVRVTKSRSVIQKISEFLEKMSD
ncbi:uncharacterized protein LOC120357591 [Solenopsis invicta]|uniref:uncharacterized protein LOC120357591 n=1 Tax=Solenopsis invicta TaxID=13686 RepID=UPI00193E8126|nr:uncharacterized protein LOC120357591 [Solenopsis invicta]